MHADPQTQYVSAQTRPSFPALLADFAARSDAATATGPCTLDARYGPLARQTFDLFAAPGSARGVLAYFHAGYWQSRDKALFRFIAPALTRRGLDVALINYPLCPSVELPELVAAARAALPVMRQRAGGVPLIAAGHSAGAHLAVEFAAHADAVLALSGVYELTPLVETTLNDKLRLDPAAAAACSPVRRVPADLPSALFVVGGAETAAFVAQNAAMQAAWTAAGNDAAAWVEPGADHFSLLEAWTADTGALPDRFDAWLTQVLG